MLQMLPREGGGLAALGVAHLAETQCSSSLSPSTFQEEGPAGEGSPHRSPARGWAHPAYSEVPYYQIPQKSSCWQRLQPRRA